MRTAGFLILAILFPVFAHAATLVNINTASATTLEDLPGIGPSTAASIIANRPYASIEDISRAAGIGAPGSSSYEKIKGLITVGDTGVVNNSNTSDTSNNTASSTQDTSASLEDTTYVPPPSELTVDAGSNTRDAVMNVPLIFSARVMAKGGAEDSSARISWGFGDGSSAEDTEVEKTYNYAGTYLVVITATDGEATGRDEIVVTVRPAQVRMVDVSNAGVRIANDASERLDLSSWILYTDTGSFRIPEGTVMLPKMSILFSSTVTKLASTPDTFLTYPDGAIAVPVLSANPQPSVSNTSFNMVNKVEPIISTNEGVPAVHENTAVSAPAATTELAAAGAALPVSLESAPAENTRAAGIFKSPWTLGFIGTILLAGGAFIFI